MANTNQRKPTTDKARTLPAGFKYPAGWTDRSGEHGYTVAVFLDSIEALSAGEVHPSNQGQDIAQKQNQPDEKDSWSGGLTRLDSWKAKGIEGWPEGVTRMHKALKAVKAGVARDVRRRRTRGAEGDDFDIHSVYGGRLDTAWERMTPRIGSGTPVVRLWIEASTPGGRSAESMFWRGAAAMAVTERLEEAGYRVEIQLYSNLDKLWETGKGDFFRAVCAKRADRTLDLESLTFLSAHPASHRVAGFLAYLVHPWECQEGLGHPDHSIPSFVDTERDLCVRNVWSATEAQAWVVETMTRYA